MAVTIDGIRTAVRDGHWLLTTHARRSMVARNIVDADLVAMLQGGNVLEDYPNDPRGSSALVLGFTTTGHPLHAVCAFDPGGTLLIITIYEPMMPWWLDERTRHPRGGNL